MHHSDEIKPLIIVGTGPAGLTAAIYAARANLKPLVFEGKEPGGQLTLTTEVENFPGFPEGIQGPELINRMREQAKKFGAVFLQEPITNCQLSNSPFQFQSANGNNFQSYSAIISTGASAKFLGLAMEKELTGRGVSTCATCDGFFYKNKIVHVVGGGDTAMEDANFISKFAEKVFLVHRRDKFRPLKQCRIAH